MTGDGADARGSTRTMPAAPLTPSERMASGLLVALVIAAQVSMAAASIFLFMAITAWLAVILRERSRPAAPRCFWPLVAYAAVTMLSVAWSYDVVNSLWNSKEVVLYLLVPLVYRFARGRRAWTIADAMLSAGALIAICGIVQYAIFGFDHLGHRPRGTLGHYMTFSGLLMAVANLALARVLFERRGRTWAALVLPALIVALALTFTRSAWVGACAGIVVLLALKSPRLVIVVPVVLVVAFVTAPAAVRQRALSILDLNDPTNRDRVAMAEAGLHMVADHPVLGVGPDSVKLVYERYRVPGAVEAVVSHLHNNPLQIAAERGLPALALWAWFLVLAVRQVRAIRDPAVRPLVAAALATMASLLGAGLFEYNFGDSEFLIQALTLITLPLAAAQHDTPAGTPVS